MHVDETIVAVASSHDGNGLRGIVRLSGPETIACVRQVFCSTECDWERLTRPRRVPGTLQLQPQLGEVDCALYLWPTSRSYTRQPVAELHTWGARPLLQHVVDQLSQAGARLARPGEFTLRAFLAGRIDLAQAEAVLGVIDAVDDRELSVALTQLAGGLSQPLSEIRETLLNLVADLEAGLDFVEEDIEFVSQEHLRQELTRAAAIIEATLQQTHHRDAGGQLPRVVLRGEPNAGKSSLWNCLVRGQAAIVTDQAGTTRDYLQGTVDRGGLPFQLIDTAGVDPAEDPLHMAIRETTNRQAAEADLVLLCLDASRPRTDWERGEQAGLAGKEHLVVATKCDQVSSPIDFQPHVITSSQTGAGIEQLVQRIVAALDQMPTEAAVVANTALRCRESLRQAGESIGEAHTLALAEAGDELVVAEIRHALDHLGQVVGVIYTDDILDRVFSRFCIGK